jgi:prepilin-type processing-associated H-X9-DG protein
MNTGLSSSAVDTLARNRYRGMFAPYIFKNFALITDGLSNTVAISEGAIAPRNHDTPATPGQQGTIPEIKGGMGGNFTTTDLITSGMGPSIIMARRSTSDPTMHSGQLGRVHRGWGVIQGLFLVSGFQTICPPNSSSVAGRTWSDVTSGVVSATSFHPGGVNVTMGDGSVRFVSDTIQRSAWLVASASYDGQAITLP